MLKITKYVVYDILRSKVLILYTAFLGIASMALFNLETDPAKAIISLLSIVMIILPLVSIVFSTTYFYNAYEFMELLVSQPLQRRTIILAQYMGIGLCLVLAYVIGVGIPMLLFAPGEVSVILLFAGIMLTLSFTAFAFLASVLTRDKARGIGVSLLLWFYLAILYDAILIGILYAFNDYPLEKVVIGLAACNPIDLARIMVLLKLDISALMGYTGAVFQEIFGNGLGIAMGFVVLTLWVLLPLWLSVRIFRRKNI
ncbi:MAG: ABC transporter permease subunit [Bacteroidetes bacterium]|nr:ABC transporter permease subunit [Bacteroidota bacterium]